MPKPAEQVNEDIRVIDGGLTIVPHFFVQQNNNNMYISLYIFFTIMVILLKMVLLLIGKFFGKKNW